MNVYTKYIEFVFSMLFVYAIVAVVDEVVVSCRVFSLSSYLYDWPSHTNNFIPSSTIVRMRAFIYTFSYMCVTHEGGTITLATFKFQTLIYFVIFCCCCCYFHIWWILSLSREFNFMTTSNILKHNLNMVKELITTIYYANIGEI